MSCLINGLSETKVFLLKLGRNTVHLPASWGHSTAPLSDHSNSPKIRHTGKWMCQALLQKQNQHTVIPGTK